MSKKLLYSFVGLLFGSGCCQAALTPDNEATQRQVYAEKNYYIVHPLHYDWQVYDRQYKVYVPYLREKHANVYTASLSMGILTNQGYDLVLYSDQEMYVFVDAALQRKIRADSWTVLRLDSLGRTFGRVGAPRDSIFLTFYSPSGALPLETAFIGHRKTGQQAAALAAPALSVLPKQTSDFTNFLILASVFVLFNYAFLFNLHSTAFARFYSTRNLLIITNREVLPQVGKPLDGINLLFLLNHGLLLSLLYMLVRQGSQQLLFPEKVLRQQESLLDYGFNFFVVGFALFFLIILKYLLTYLLGNLFRMEKLVHVHFFEYIHLSKVFYTWVVPVLVIVFTSYPAFVNTADELCVGLILGFSFLRILLISVSLNKLAPHRNLYLFSYLCVTELVPLLTGIKILL